MNRKGQKAFKSDLQDTIDDFIGEICEKAEQEREKAYISDASVLWMLSDSLCVHLKWIDQALKCKSITAVEKLRKKIELLDENYEAHFTFTKKTK